MSDEIHISNNRSEVYNLLRGKNAGIQFNSNEVVKNWHSILHEEV